MKFLQYRYSNVYDVRKFFEYDDGIGVYHVDKIEKGEFEDPVEISQKEFEDNVKNSDFVMNNMKEINDVFIRLNMYALEEFTDKIGTYEYLEAQFESYKTLYEQAKLGVIDNPTILEKYAEAMNRSGKLFYFANRVRSEITKMLYEGYPTEITKRVFFYLKKEEIKSQKDIESYISTLVGKCRL